MHIVAAAAAAAHFNVCTCCTLQCLTSRAARRRHHTETHLVKVSVVNSPSGIALLSLSKYSVNVGPSPALPQSSTSLAPYRIDNCTKRLLTVWQAGYPSNTDTIEQYSSAAFVWDDPALAHTLTVATGNVVLCSVRCLFCFIFPRIKSSITMKEGCYVRS